MSHPSESLEDRIYRIEEILLRVWRILGKVKLPPFFKFSLLDKMDQIERDQMEWLLIVMRDKNGHKGPGG